MAEHDRPTVVAATMTNAHTNPPTAGSKVWALNHGGVINDITWTSESIKSYDAWYPYLKVPPEVKAIQTARYGAKPSPM